MARLSLILLLIFISNLVDAQTQSDSDDTTSVTASFPGGDYALHEFVQKNIVYPQLAKEMRIQGVVYTQFIINTDGSISDITIVRGIDPLLDNEVIRLIKLMPNWIPEKQNGKLVRVRYTLPITFKLHY